ncbi:MAG: hypothetical protein KGZ45_06620 [Clostridium sp.]|nr:hypothetical protein [Clostridium sp.]
MSDKPDLGKTINGLKDFQRQTVEYVFRRLYLDERPSQRFLIADEVGLGKTMVAKGVIAKAIQHLWKERDRLDIIYICSNHEIARQNIERLNVTANGFSLASRITLLPLKHDELNNSNRKVNFISFTPGTSFDLRSSCGVITERALLYDILKKEWGLGSKKGPVNLLQVDAGKENWRNAVKCISYKYSPTSELIKVFKEELQKRIEKASQKGQKDICTRFHELAERFNWFRKGGVSRILCK